MKTNYKYILIAGLVTLFASCNEWLKEPTPNETSIDEYFSSEAAAVNNVSANYVPLTWEWNANTFYNEFFFGDIMSDDALKGGNGIPDCSYFYSLENFKGNADNDVLLQYYRTNYIGIARCNLSLTELPKMDEALFTTEGMKKRLIAESKFLRAMYYFRLVRIFQDVPLVTEILDKNEEWKQPVSPVADVYTLILSDLNDAVIDLWEKDDARFVPASDMGRITKGAAQAMLLKVNLYLKDYAEAEKWGKAIIDGAQYSLHADYGFNFTLEGENQAESVFEIQYISDGQSDWGQGIGYTLALVIVCVIRELLGAGTFGGGLLNGGEGIRIIPEGYAPMYIVMPVGGFLVLGCVLAASKYLTKRMTMKNMKKEAGK